MDDDDAIAGLAPSELLRALDRRLWPLRQVHFALRDADRENAAVQLELTPHLGIKRDFKMLIYEGGKSKSLAEFI